LALLQRPSAGRTTIFAVHTLSFTKAAGVSPPWYAIQTPCGENRTSSGDWRHGNQERRASARRGWAKSHPHTRPLFVGGPPTVCVRIALAFAFLGATGGLRPPLLVLLQCGDFPAKLRLVRCTNAGLQERRASARRGNGIEPWMASRNSPAHGRTQQERRVSARRGTRYKRRAVRIEHRPATGDTAIKSGGRQPAVGGQNRIRIHDRYSSADRRRCVCGLPLHSRF